MREGVVLYDRAGREIWACPNVDSRSAEEAADLVREGAAEKIYAEAGDWVSITTPARLRWLARHRPDILDAVGSLGMLSDWIIYRLSGAQVTEPSCGSSSGMFTLAQRTWSASIPELCGLPASVLPPVVDPGTVVGQVTSAAAEQTGLRPVLRWWFTVPTPAGAARAGISASTPWSRDLLAEHRAAGAAIDPG
jgi:autoinducer 2 (AI-2) kinase